MLQIARSSVIYIKGINMSIMKRLLPILLLLCAAQAFSQEPLDSVSFAEMEDSISSLAFKRLKSTQADKLLWKVIRRCNKDLQQKHEVSKYNIIATFNRDSFPSYSINCVISAEAGIGLEKVKLDDFISSGVYELTRRDSIYIREYLRTFVTLSPISARGWFFIPVGSKVGLLSPFLDYSRTTKYYYMGAYSISDEMGRGVYRMVFVRNKKRQLKNVDRRYDPPEITGTAYIDTNTYQLKQFKGKAYLPTLQYDPYLNYQVDYEENCDTPILKQINISWSRDKTLIRATVSRVIE